MPDKILHKRSLTSGSIPTTSSLSAGELAINIPDGKIYILKSGSAGQSVESAITSNSTSSIGTLLLSGSLILSGSTSINSGSVLDVSADNITFDFDYLSFSGSAEITGSLIVTRGITAASFTGSLLGTSSWAQNAVTASYVLNAVSSSFATSASYALSSSFAQTASLARTASFALTSSIATTASYVLNAISSSFASTASSVNPLNQNVIITGSLNVTQNITGSRALLSASSGTISGSTLIVYGSGSAQPVFTIQGSQGELFSVTDSLSGSLFSVNDISGLPILEVFSDNTTLIGNYLDPMLITTTKVTQTNSGSFVVYSLPTASYDTAFFEYSIRSGSNARAGSIMAIQSGSSVNFTETTTTDFGSTSAVSFTVVVTGSNMALTGSSSTGSWITKCIIRGV